MANGFGEGLTSGLRSQAALNRNNIAGQLGVAGLQQDERQLQFKQTQQQLDALSTQFTSGVEDLTAIAQERGPDAARRVADTAFAPQVLEGLATGFQQFGRQVTPEQLRRQVDLAIAQGATPEEIGTRERETAAAAGGITEEQARAANVEFSRRADARATAAAARPEFEASDFKAALAMRASGNEIPPGLFPGTMTQTVNEFSPEQAQGQLGSLQGARSVRVNPDGSMEIVEGGGANVRAREEAKLEASESAPINSAVANIAGFPPNTTVGEAREQGINVDIDDKQLGELQNQRGATKNAMLAAAELVKQIQGRPELVGAPGGLASIVGSVGSQIAGFAALAEQMLGEENVDASTDPADYSDALTEIGVENRVVQSRVIDLAFAIATSRESGRLSESDIRNALKTIGESGSPEQFVGVLMDMGNRLERKFNIQAESILGVQPAPLFGDQ